MSVASRWSGRHPPGDGLRSPSRVQRPSRLPHGAPVTHRDRSCGISFQLAAELCESSLEVVLDRGDLRPREVRHLSQRPPEAVNEHHRRSLPIGQRSEGGDEIWFKDRFFVSLQDEGRFISPVPRPTLSHSKEVAGHVVHLRQSIPVLPGKSKSLGGGFAAAVASVRCDEGTTKPRFVLEHERRELSVYVLSWARPPAERSDGSGQSPGDARAAHHYKRVWPALDLPRPDGICLDFALPHCSLSEGSAGPGTWGGLGSIR